MDLFGVKKLQAEIESKDETIRNIARDLRDMDQIIFQMSQCQSWDTMRPYFNILKTLADNRMQIESKRVGDIVRKEILNTYSDQGNM